MGEMKEALDRAAGGIRSVLDDSGPDAFGMFSCSKATNEMNYMAQKFARAVVGAEDERAPQLMGMMLSGVLAFGEVSDQLPEGTASAVEVEASGKELHVDAAMGLDDFLELVEGLEELKGNL